MNKCLFRKIFLFLLASCVCSKMLFPITVNEKIQQFLDRNRLSISVAEFKSIANQRVRELEREKRLEYLDLERQEKNELLRKCEIDLGDLRRKIIEVARDNAIDLTNELIQEQRLLSSHQGSIKNYESLVTGCQKELEIVENGLEQLNKEIEDLRSRQVEIQFIQRSRSVNLASPCGDSLSSRDVVSPVERSKSVNPERVCDCKIVQVPEVMSPPPRRSYLEVVSSKSRPMSCMPIETKQSTLEDSPTERGRSVTPQIGSTTERLAQPKTRRWADLLSPENLISDKEGKMFRLLEQKEQIEKNLKEFSHGIREIRDKIKEDESLIEKYEKNLNWINRILCYVRSKDFDFLKCQDPAFRKDLELDRSQFEAIGKDDPNGYDPVAVINEILRIRGFDPMEFTIVPAREEGFSYTSVRNSIFFDKQHALFLEDFKESTCHEIEHMINKDWFFRDAIALHLREQGVDAMRDSRCLSYCRFMEMRSDVLSALQSVENIYAMEIWAEQHPLGSRNIRKDKYAEHPTYLQRYLVTNLLRKDIEAYVLKSVPKNALRAISVARASADTES